MEGLSILIFAVITSWDLIGVKLTDVPFITHLLFVDNVLIFLDGSIRDTSNFLRTLSTFYKATSMLPNQIKSTITTVNCKLNERDYALNHLQYRHLVLEEGITYFGYRLKPNNYHILDWTWLIAKIESHVNIW